MAFDDESISSICLISDGKPDCSAELCLAEVERVNGGHQQREIRINVVAFNCEDAGANEFLRNLANQNRGRFHRCSENDREIQLFAHKIITEGVHDSFVC